MPAGRRTQEDEAGRSPEAGTERPPPAPAPDVAGILAMQQGVGNAAVSRHLMRDKTAETTEAEQEKNLDLAFKAEDWDAYVAILTKLDRKKVRDKLLFANQDQLMRIDDAAKRANLPASGRVRENCRYHLGKWYRKKGKRQKTGYGFGDLKVRYGKIENGEAGVKNYGLEVEIWFTPDEKEIDAEEIAFIQRVRLVETSSGDNKDWDETNKKRTTARNSSVDRIPGRKWGWYGMNQDEGAGGNLKKWVKGAEKNAWMYDRPSAQIPNTTWEFETAAVCRKGAEVGKVYGVTTWGFTVDANLKVKPMDVRFFNKPSMDFEDVVTKWNEQADMPEADRNDPDQQKLPEVT